MKTFNNYLKSFGVIIILIVVFRGFLYRSFINYSKVKIRNNIGLINKKLIAEIESKIEDKKLTIEEIITLSNRITANQLNFTFNKTSRNPNVVYKLKRGNCIGYSSLFNSIGNYIVTSQNLNNQYEFYHLVGKLDVLGYDIHSLFESNFFKDHDFNKVEDKITGKNKFIDPSLRDYLKIKYVTSK